MIGTIAAILTTASFVPDALKAILKKDVSGVNLGMYSIFTSGVLLWTIYGAMTMQMNVLVANGITLCFAAVTLVTKIRLDVLPAIAKRRSSKAVRVAAQPQA